MYICWPHRAVASAAPGSRRGAKPISAQPYLTFSEDWRYAFVERARLTAARIDVIARLDARLRDTEHPATPPIRRWRPHRAYVLGPERWDEADGRRLRRDVPGSRVLWRVDVSRALELEPPGRSHGRRLLDRLTELSAEGRLDRDDLIRARLLNAAVEEAEAERRLRQAIRPPDAPRAPLKADAAALLGRLMLVVMGALGTQPDAHGDEVARALRGMQQRLEAEEERQVLALRAELDALGYG